jgi:hypothetical protein
MEKWRHEAALLQGQTWLSLPSFWLERTTCFPLISALLQLPGGLPSPEDVAKRGLSKRKAQVGAENLSCKTSRHVVPKWPCRRTEDGRDAEPVQCCSTSRAPGIDDIIPGLAQGTACIPEHCTLG